MEGVAVIVRHGACVLDTDGATVEVVVGNVKTRGGMVLMLGFG